MRWFKGPALGLTLAACGGSAATATSSAGPQGSGTVKGADGEGFGVAAALWIGAPDDPGTTVVYLFSKAVGCGQLAPSGWADDGRLPKGTAFLELKMKGTKAPDSFTVLGGAANAPHEALVNYSLTSLDGSASTETLSSGGTTTLGSLEAMTRAVGTFSISLGTARLEGSFDAAYCGRGTEP